MEIKVSMRNFRNVEDPQGSDTRAAAAKREKQHL
jgi:hypothetical protein